MSEETTEEPQKIDPPGESNKYLELKRELRKKNKSRNRTDDESSRRLVSNVRKATSFVKQLKTISEDKNRSILTFA